MPWLAGVTFAGLGAAASLALGLVLPAIPVLTIALLLGLVLGQIPAVQRPLTGVLAPGVAVAARRLLRVGIVLLGFKLSLATIASLGWVTIVLLVALVAVSFVSTWAIAKLWRLPGRQPLMMAAGFSICGVSAIGAMAGTTRAKSDDTATPIAMVTLFGSLGIMLLPLVAGPLGLTGEAYGVWVGASLHDVGQVVAAGQAGGAAALAIAVTVKLTRVVTLAPMVAIVGAVERRRAAVAGERGARPPIVPLFIVFFVVIVLVNSFVELPAGIHAGADVAQTVLFAAALFAIGCGIRLRTIARSGARAVGAGIAAWAVICVLALGVVWAFAAH
jgi:uncharacterized integral membrane protein (TIGR00698 family)